MYRYSSEVYYTNQEFQTHTMHTRGAAPCNCSSERGVEGSAIFIGKSGALNEAELSCEGMSARANGRAFTCNCARERTVTVLPRSLRDNAGKLES